VAIAARELKIINPDLKVSSYDMKIQDVPSSALESAAVMIEGLDTFRDRRWVNSYVVEKGIPLISGGLFGFFGNLQVVIPQESACLECQSLIPEEELQKACTPFGDARKKIRSEKSEEEEKIPSVSSVSFVIGGLMAQEALKIILELPPLKKYLFWDGGAGVFTALELTKRSDCFVCSSEYQLDAIPVRSAKNQTINDFIIQLQYSFNLGDEMTVLLGANSIERSQTPLSSLIQSEDIIRVIDPALSKPLKFQILLD
jgi:molybdopterin/thiamine biosynthesis adenylyltransferase